MILIDTSAWAEFLRGTDSPACRAVDRALSEPIATCDPISMEVLAGARDEPHLRELRGLLGRCRVLPTGPVEFDDASALYRRCRRAGETPRRLIDCLIASVALRHAAIVLHADTDFDVLARHSALRVHEFSAS